MNRLLYVMPLVALCGCANMRIKMSAVDLDARKPDQILAANADVAAFYRVEPTVAVAKEQKVSLPASFYSDAIKAFFEWSVHLRVLSFECSPVGVTP